MNNQSDVRENSADRIIAVVLAFSLLYAVVRYHIAGPVPWQDLPFFILNKGISLGAFILLAMNFGLGPLNNLGVKVSRGWLNARKAMGMTGFLLVLIHALMSFMLFSPANYGKFFVENGSLTLLGGLPPISLVAFTFFAVGYVINLFGRE